MFKLTLTTLALCLILAAVGCSNKPAANPNGGGMDSPIIVSDGIYLRHQGRNHDFHVVPGANVQVTVDVTGTLYLVCWKNVSNCSDNTPVVQLTAPWTIQIYKTANGSGQGDLTITSSDNKTVTTTFNNAVTVDADADNTGDTAKGTQLALNQNGYDFQSFSYGNGDSSKGSYNCGTGTCKIKITYQ